jgi:hypothetical protein
MIKLYRFSELSEAAKLRAMTLYVAEEIDIRLEQDPSLHEFLSIEAANLEDNIDIKGYRQAIHDMSEDMAKTVRNLLDWDVMSDRANLPSELYTEDGSFVMAQSMGKDLEHQD